VPTCFRRTHATRSNARSCRDLCVTFADGRPPDWIREGMFLGAPAPGPQRGGLPCRAVPDDPIGGRTRTPEGVLAADADCELELDYVLATYLGRDEFCSVLVEDVLLGPQLGHDKKLDLLRKILRRHELTFPPLNTLAADLAVLRRFRNELTHTVAYRGNPLQRVKRRRGQNELITVTQSRSPSTWNEGCAASPRCTSCRCMSRSTRRPTSYGRPAGQASLGRGRTAKPSPGGHRGLRTCPALPQHPRRNASSLAAGPLLPDERARLWFMGSADLAAHPRRNRVVEVTAR
jgi:hypothetical protein